MLGDIAVLTGATYFSEDLGRKPRERSSSASSARPRRSSSPRTTPRSSRAPARRRTSPAGRADPQPSIEKTTSDYDREKLQERLAKLTGGVAIINVGGATEQAQKDARTWSTTPCTPPARPPKEGYVPGGGVALLRTIEAIRPARRRPRATRSSASTSWLRAIEAPARQIAINAGYDGDLAVETVKKRGQLRPQRRHRRLRRPRQGRHHRPGPGRQERPDQRGERRGADAHHRCDGHRPEGGHQADRGRGELIEPPPRGTGGACPLLDPPLERGRVGSGGSEARPTRGAREPSPGGKPAGLDLWTRSTHVHAATISACRRRPVPALSRYALDATGRTILPSSRILITVAVRTLSR
jgi:hypothetical protein